MAISFRPVNQNDVVIAKLDASQTIAEGDPLVIASGVVAIAVANSSASIYGVAAEDATSAASGDYYIKVYPARANARFRATASGTISIANLFTATAACYDLAGTTGAFTVNISATSQDIFKIVDIPNGVEHGTFGTDVIVTVNKSAFEPALAL